MKNELDKGDTRLFTSTNELDKGDTRFTGANGYCPPHPPQYDSWDRPPDIILVVMRTCMLLMIYVCGYICLLCVYIYITTQTRVYSTPS